MLSLWFRSEKYSIGFTNFEYLNNEKNFDLID